MRMHVSGWPDFWGPNGRIRRYGIVHQMGTLGGRRDRCAIVIQAMLEARQLFFASHLEIKNSIQICASLWAAATTRIELIDELVEMRRPASQESGSANLGEFMKPWSSVWVS